MERDTVRKGGERREKEEKYVRAWKHRELDKEGRKLIVYLQRKCGRK